jgi:hypothetical protein
VNWIVVVAAVLLALASALSGSLVFLVIARKAVRREVAYQIKLPSLRYVATALGALTGLGVVALAAYFVALNRWVTPIEWIGRASYLLIAAAVGGHLLNLALGYMRLRREEKALSKKDAPAAGSLGAVRYEAIQGGERRFTQYADLKSRDDEVIEELLGVVANPLLDSRRDMARIPFYGYLGTVCGILLMAHELGRINEATETFKVLSSMAGGLVLAFQTTLVALVAYLPLRKANDHLLQRLAGIEEVWRHWRTERVEKR